MSYWDYVVRTSYNGLVKRFKESNIHFHVVHIHDDEVTWEFEIEYNGIKFHIYDWKQYYALDDDTIAAFHIGTDTRENSKIISEWLKNECGFNSYKNISCLNIKNVRTLQSIFKYVKTDDTNALAQDILMAFYGMTEEEQQFYLSFSISGVIPKDLQSIPNPFPVPQPNEINKNNVFCTLHALLYGVFDLLIKTVGHLNKSGITAEEIQEYFRRILLSDIQVLTYKWFLVYLDGIEKSYMGISYPQSEIDEVKKQAGVNDIQAKWIIRQIEILTDYARSYFGPGKQNPASLTLDFGTLINEAHFLKCDTRDVQETDIINAALSSLRGNQGLLQFQHVFTSDGYIINFNSMTRVVKLCLPYPFYSRPIDFNYNVYLSIMDPGSNGFSRKTQFPKSPILGAKRGVEKEQAHHP